MKRAALLAFALAGCVEWDPLDKTGVNLLQANVGNTALACEGYAFKLCKADVEDRVRDSIAQLAPDLLVLQEVLPDTFCDGFVDDDAARVCGAGREGAQIERLLPEGYTHVCEARNGYECVAARAGVVLGEPLSAPPVTSADEDCDDGFTVSSVDVTGVLGSFRVINGHPQSGFIGACRSLQVAQIFETLTDDRSLVSGDMNLDPFNVEEPSRDAWVSHVGSGEEFRYHSGPAEHEPPYYTTENVLLSATLDHVVSNFMEEACETLGAAPGTEPIDGDGVSLDHRALSCALVIDNTK
jgi:hypothetical protein